MDADDIDMFADLEQTLCEGLTDLRFTRDSEDKHSMIHVDCLEDVKDMSKINGPAVRSYNLYKATKAYQNKQYLDSVYFESFAMSLSMRIKFYANRIMEAEQHMPTQENLAHFLEDKPAADQPTIVDYVDRFLKDMLQDDRPTKKLKSIEFENGAELMKLCHELPKEWTVIQLCKQMNTEIFLETSEETLRHPKMIFLTLFCYQMSERFDHRPIKIVLNQKDLKELYESSHDIFTKLNAHDSYHHFRKMPESDFEMQTVSKLKKLLGPWIVLFSGKSKHNSAIDKKTIAKVDLFLSKSPHKYSKRQNVLICLIALRINILSQQLISDGALYISRTKHEWWELIDFFDEVKLIPGQRSHKRYPVILVVDEHLDFMFWEMCNTDQEFTRVDSMLTLLKLYFHHQEQISGGYFNVKGTEGSAVINPDRTLADFTRIVHPVVELLPNTTWKCLVDKEPIFNDLKGMLRDSDVYVYCGHGSGLQFITSYETCQLSTNAVVFLMGCSSVAFKADTGYSMATSAHHYYHIAKSPAVIGHLTTAYTSTGSLALSVMLGKWFSNVYSFNPKMLPGYEEIGKKLQAAFKYDGPEAILPSPYLSEVISQFRKKFNLIMPFRAIICHRGLPVSSGNAWK